MESSIKKWKELSSEDRQVIIIKLTYEFNFGFKLSYHMPAGHEADYSYYDESTNIFSFNYDLIKDDDTLNALFVLFTEIRKYMQLKNIDSSALVQRSLNYEFLYDGTVYTRIDGALIEVNLEGERKYLKQLYICAPNTYDYNKFAYDKILSYIGDDSVLIDELNQIYSYWKPTWEFFGEKDMEKEYNEVFETIDNLAKAKA
ncbi:MAG: hypothetical protein ACI4U5_03255 [Bacilli bacterium]